MKATQAPVHELRIGRIRAAVWENQNANGRWFNVTFSRLYKDGDSWRDAQSFGSADLPVIADLATQARCWIEENTPDDGEE